MVSRKGSSAVEVLIATGISVMVLFGVNQLLVYSATSAELSEFRLRPRESAQAALARIRTLLIDAKSYQLDDPRHLTIRSAAGTHRLSFTRGQLVLESPGTAARTLLPVKSCTFAIVDGADGLIRLTLELARRSRYREDTFRLEEEILVPLVHGPAHAGAPWVPVPAR
jgi:hypothetical protein